MKSRYKFGLMAVLLGMAVFWLWPESPPDYAYYARTGEHPMLPKYEIKGDDYRHPYGGRLGTRTHWTECRSSPMETKAECVLREGCIGDGDCLEWEDWLARNE